MKSSAFVVLACVSLGFPLLALGQGFLPGGAPLTERPSTNATRLDSDAAFIVDGKLQLKLDSCVQPFGKIVVDENQNLAFVLTPHDLPASPTPLITEMLQASRCFIVLNRGPGQALAERERARLNPDGAKPEFPQEDVADFVLTTDVVVAANYGHGDVAGAFLTLGIVGGASDKAKATLQTIDVRTSENTVVIGEAGIHRSGAFGIVMVPDIDIDGGRWEKSARGQTIVTAYADAVNKLIRSFKARHETR